MNRESIPTGWDGHFKRIYLPSYLFILGYLILIPTIIGIIFWINIFEMSETK